MPSNTTTTSLPPETHIIAFIGPRLQSLVIGHTFLVLLIPLFIALFYYSTPANRRQPIFILNVLAIVLAFAAGVVSDALNIHMILSPEDMWPARLQVAIGFIGNFQAMLVDAILLVRLITVHPLSRIGFTRFALLTSLPIMIKIARLVNTSLYIRDLSNLADGPNAFRMITSAWLTLPYLKIEWIAQVVDNSYASIAFIWTIQTFRTNTMPQGIQSAINFRESSVSSRVRILSNLALSNFIIPTLISIVQLILLSRVGEANPFLLNDFGLVNARVSVFGVVFATVWAGREHLREANMQAEPSLVQHEQWGTLRPDKQRPLSLSRVSIVHKESDDTSSATTQKNISNQHDDPAKGVMLV